jgi:hypothetical protein
MGQKTISTSLTPKVSIQAVHGNLQVKGWDRPEILLRYKADEQIVLDELEDSIQISCHGDCVIRLPQEATIQTEVINGNARFKLLEGRLTIERVAGSLDLRNIESAQINTIEGNLLAKGTTGDLLVERVQGNALARDIQGLCKLQQIGGNLDLRDAEEDIDVSAGGNIRVQLCLLSGQHYCIQAGGNLHCMVPEDSSLQADMTSGARRIQLILPEGKSTLAEGKHSLTLGEGEARMILEAIGSIHFARQEADWYDTAEIQYEFDEAFAEFSDDFGQQVSDQIELQIETQMEILNEQLSKLEAIIGTSDMPPEDTERIMQRARQASERANIRAQEKMRRAQEKLDRKLQAAQRKAELRMKAVERRKQTPMKRSWSLQSSSTPPPATTEAASDEERLFILRMLEEKKITIEEAEQLLAALEGKQD